MPIEGKEKGEKVMNIFEKYEQFFKKKKMFSAFARYLKIWIYVDNEL